LVWGETDEAMDGKDTILAQSSLKFRDIKYDLLTWLYTTQGAYWMSLVCRWRGGIQPVDYRTKDGKKRPLETKEKRDR
jgi:hypothetical protein